MSTARKPGLFRRLSIGAALLGVVAAPVALAIPAEAATTRQGCTVNPLAPVFAGRNAAAIKQVRYNFVVNCNPGRSIEVHQGFFEQDPPGNPDDFTGDRIRSYSIVGVDTKGITLSLPNTEAGPETIYQVLRFRVTPTATGVQGPWTALEPSGALTIAN